MRSELFGKLFSFELGSKLVHFFLFQLPYSRPYMLNIEKDLSLVGLLCTAVQYTVAETPPTPPPPSAFGLIFEGAIGQQRIR